MLGGGQAAEAKLRFLNTPNILCNLTIVLFQKMSVWKLQCYFCPETVSSVQLNKDYYLLHLVAVHNVQQHADKLLEWLLAQKGVGQSVCLPVPVSTSVAVIRSRKVSKQNLIT